MSYCEIYKAKDCVGCPQQFKDYCEGVNRLIRERKKAYKRANHIRKNNSTYKQIMKYVEASDTLDLTSTEILEKITSNDKRISTNVFYINEVMQEHFLFKKIKGKLYYYAKFREVIKK